MCHILPKKKKKGGDDTGGEGHLHSATQSRRVANREPFGPVLLSFSATGDFLGLALHPQLPPSSLLVGFLASLPSLVSPPPFILLHPLFSSCLSRPLFISPKGYLSKTTVTHQEELDVCASRGTCNSFQQVIQHLPDYAFMSPMSPGQGLPLW